MRENNFPFVSVVITTKDEEKNIANCLKSIRLQTYPSERIEIIVVDNPDTKDKTREIVKEFNAKLYIYGNERSSQRNFGIKKSAGKYVIYLDADMILSPSVVKTAVEKFGNNDVIAFYIPEIVLGSSVWNRIRRFERSFYDATAIDCARIFKRDAFLEVNGFDENITGPEDWDFDKKLRLKGKVKLLNKYSFDLVDRQINCSNSLSDLRNLSKSALIFHNETNFKFSKYFKKKAYYSQSFKKYISKWGEKDTDIRKQFGFWYRYLGVFIEQNKWKRVIKNIHLFLGMLILRVGIGVVYLSRK